MVSSQRPSQFLPSSAALARSEDGQRDVSNDAGGTTKIPADWDASQSLLLPRSVAADVDAMHYERRAGFPGCSYNTAIVRSERVRKVRRCTTPEASGAHAQIGVLSRNR